MSPRAWISTITIGAICWLIAVGVAAGWDSATRGELVVLHLGSE
ncbi:hypothetical protein [Methylobacterium hispanicum]